MTKAVLLNKLLSLFPAPHYLEIGVDQGHTFTQINADLKVAVDPDFKFEVDENNLLSNTHFHKCDSDSFFSANPNLAFDVIFIDGLHEFTQVLKDLLNAISHLRPHGVIVIDDVIPCHYQASLPSLEQMASFGSATGSPDMSWMGDVYKLVYFIREFLPSFTYYTWLDSNGQTILWKAPRPNELSRPNCLSFSGIDHLTYADTVIDRSVYNIATPEQVCEAIRLNLETANI